MPFIQKAPSRRNPNMAEELVRIENMVKTFPGVVALANARFDLLSGEVHALMGENGAGKSTLMKILAGIYAKDSGTITYLGQPVSIPNPRSAQHLGISIVHQELSQMNHLTAAQNMFIGREPRHALGLLLDEQKLNEQAQEYFSLLNLDLDPRTRIGDLTVAKQQMVEIAKALSFKSRVLIMDEPTASLTTAEIEELFRIIRGLKAQGVGIVYISHKMDELKQISDRVTVMRDGQYVGTVPTAETSMDTIIKMMVGRTLFETARNVAGDGTGELLLDVRHLMRGRAVRDISFTARRGEILGFAGLMGAGRTEVARAVFGADPIDSGEIWVKGRRVAITQPRHAVRAGIGYLSEDRKRYGLALGLSVATNVVLACLSRFRGALGWMRDGAMRTVAQQNIKTLAIKTPGINQKVQFLSGGNQQKVVIAKWINRDCDVLIFDEPTRGIDIGAKQEIYKLLNDLAQEGKAVIMISSELPEIIRMSHRILVMCEGRISGELQGAEVTQEKIMYYATLRETMVAGHGDKHS
jgi:ribose transport system ATP-binding protein